MRVSSVNQLTNQNTIQAKRAPQMTSINKISKADSVSFSGKTNLLEELFTAIKAAKTVTIYEKPANCVYRSVVEADNVKYALTHDHKKVLGMVFDKCKIRKFISEAEVQAQKIDKKEFENLIVSVRQKSIPRIFEAHGFQQKNASELLKDIKIGLQNKSIKIWNSSTNGSHDGTLVFEKCLELPKEKLVTLHINEKNKLYELSIEGDKILLTGTNETKQFKEVLDSDGFKSAMTDFTKRMFGRA